MEVLEELQGAGLDGLPGGGGEILVDHVRKHRRIAPARISADQWTQIMGEAQSLGMYTTATMVIGFGETTQQRVQSLVKVRDRHESSLECYGNGFSAFISWTLQTEGVRVQDAVPGSNPHEYLQNLAVSRLLLNTVDNFQVSWPTMGYKVAQAGLYFGANDFGSTMLEENVVSQAGARHQLASEGEIIRQISNAGFRPVQRDSKYSHIGYPDVNTFLNQTPGSGSKMPFITR
jgi:2-iminoacetate synthase ThiH